MSTSAQEKKRQEMHEKKRQEMLAEYANQRATLQAAADKDHTSVDRFVKVTEGMEERLKKSTVGLVNAEEFKRVREQLEEENRRKAARTNELEKEEGRKNRKGKNGKDKKVKTLSFATGDDDEEEQGEEEEEKENRKKKMKRVDSATADDDADADTANKRTKFGKNPTVDTSFLPDREREEKERVIREELRQQYLREQEETKKQDIEIVCSYWDGSGHRTSVTCKKGDTIAQFLEKARAEFAELRQTSVDNMMYIKEDLIIPHHYTFYDFIVSKARGKSGPLFSFDVHEDVRLTHDATVEKDESHAGKIVERSWYSRNKHVFPASRWEMFDPSVDYGKYSISDKSKKKQV